MTREEELDWLCRLRSGIYVFMPKEWLIPMNDALDMAIKALEQDPTTKNDLGVDAISRAEMLKYQEYLHGKMSNEENHKLWKFIKNLPSVTPQDPKTGRWILTDVESSKVWHCNCSKCNKDPLDFVGGSENWWLIKTKLPKYCPNCGAKMETEDA